MGENVELLDGDALAKFSVALKRLGDPGLELFGLAGSQIKDLGGRVRGRGRPATG